MKSLLEIKKVGKRFGSLRALHDVSFSVDKGETIGLIGPNGAGKTTLFNTISGYFPCTSGNIKFKGRDITKASPNTLTKYGIVRTFQVPRPFGELTTFENVSVGTLFSAAERHIGGLNANEFTQNILKGVELGLYSDSTADVLSYGNKKKLELGRAQGPKPELMLLDEPFAGLSQAEMETSSSIIRKLAESGLTIIIVEHKLSELMKLVNRVVVLFFGEKIADGSPRDIAQNEQVLQAYLGRRWKNNA